MSQLDRIISGEGKLTRYGEDGEYTIKELASHIVCQDGASLSIQGSKLHYCTPRTNFGPYTHVEVGYPSVSPGRGWAKFYDGEWAPDNACDSVYGYVPIELARGFIEAHGGEA